eukprot:CAMPEP_0174307780 /NCGR_PEP_ID=MMETSP0810-20121108/1336_2 /TAXON_ID=73025 ORGANISM="Eutreptiella gymnastica-like, Strain CCMP1594" /NCGR_SAMPLE_ID=MMETSP0810 /ASSEMBLY_ACC=CAM_ASM_000659 /LENGTH=90 /DNA_ID=CAMNT_0015414923 /DNA_START=171 /DNA_END=442 /DNA_ORIENTATION=-
MSLHGCQKTVGATAATSTAGGGGYWCAATAASAAPTAATAAAVAPAFVPVQQQPFTLLLLTWYCSTSVDGLHTAHAFEPYAVEPHAQAMR